MIYIVSGQAATGTSMMMRVLIEGGIEGNYENKSTEESRRILRNPFGCFENYDINKLENRATKLLAFNLAMIIAGRKAKIIRMLRDPQHILQSRLERLDRGLRKTPMKSRERMTLECPVRSVEILKDFKAMVENAPHIEVLYVQFEDMFHDTENQIKRIADFVAPHSFDVEKAINAVDKKLYKERTGGVK